MKYTATTTGQHTDAHNFKDGAQAEYTDYKAD